MNTPRHWRTFLSSSELAREASKAWLEWAGREQKEPRFVALSGGRIAQAFFSQAAQQAGSLKLSNIHFFWADERCVAPASAESNFRMASELLFAPLSIRSENVHRIRGELSLSEAAAQANEEICRIVPQNASKLPILDLVLLGMGEDGHVASLFPNAAKEIEDCQDPYLPVSDAPKSPAERISLSYAQITAAKSIWVLISGQGKEKAVKDSLSPGDKTPLGRVLRLREDTLVFTDLSLRQ